MRMSKTSPISHVGRHVLDNVLKLSNSIVYSAFKVEKYYYLLLNKSNARVRGAFDMDLIECESKPRIGNLGVLGA
jgi:hypothetical protein